MGTLIERLRYIKKRPTFLISNSFVPVPFNVTESERECWVTYTFILEDLHYHFQ